MKSGRIARLRWAWAMDREFRVLGWGRGEFLWNYYRSRLQARWGNSESPPVVQKMLWHQAAGRSMPLRLGLFPWGGQWLVLRGVWIYQDYLHPVVKDSKTILDLGANIGAATVYMNGLNPSATFACIEPDPRNVPLLQDNLRLNGISARVFECAISGERGNMRFGLGFDTGWSALLEAGASKSESVEREIVVKTRTVPDILDDLGWAEVDLIKMDVEGAEVSILKDAGDWLPRVGNILMEIHGDGGPERMSGILERFGWRLFPVGVRVELTFLAVRGGPHSSQMRK